ncbi:MAG TPA: hypothetical protein VFC96_03615 [Anaerovoracaceae bacterium]|nr:hypothetical protein [Anaerovoracaceae bacterium]
MNRERHYFPGNNTPVGFFSYYDNILDQKEACKIWYLKGGPGTGKSTIMKKIGYKMLTEGHDVDFLHCSSDSDSIDGIVLRKNGLAIVDATPPHGIDPVNPGAVECIINLGEYWNEEGIRADRKKIIGLKSEVSANFKRAYNYLGAAEKIYDNFKHLSDFRISENVAYRVVGDIVEDVLSHRHSPAYEGKIRRFFASAFTPEGVKCCLPQIVSDCNTIYVLHAKVGSGYERIPTHLLENIVRRGFNAEAFYCSMKPDSKIEHIVVPALSFALVSSNKYHEFVPQPGDREIVNIEFNSKTDDDDLQIKGGEQEILKDMETLINRAIYWLGEAKSAHGKLEEIYIPNMDFERIELLREKIENEIRGYS